jgi:hypothetical protein
VLYTSKSCTGYTITETDIIVPSATYAYTPKEYPSLISHSHQPHATTGGYYPATTTALVTYAPTYTYSPSASSSIVYFEGAAANVGVTVSAVVGGAVLALAALL